MITMKSFLKSNWLCPVKELLAIYDGFRASFLENERQRNMINMF